MRRVPSVFDRPAVAILVSVALAAALFATSRSAESAQPLRPVKAGRVGATQTAVDQPTHATHVTTPDASGRVEGMPIAGRFLVVMHDDSTATGGVGGTLRRFLAPRRSVAADATALAKRHGARIHRAFDRGVPGFAATLTDAQATALRADPAVKQVEPDRWVRLRQTSTPWGLDRIDQRQGFDGRYNAPGNGAGVNAYVIDTGIRATHTEFGGRVQPGFAAIAGGVATTDCHGHGTHVAGTIGGATYGVARAVTLYPVQVMDCEGWGTTSDIVAGIEWMIANHVKPAVANMSLGSSGDSPALRQAVRSAITAGITVVVAAGNYPTDACLDTPAGVREAITVAAADADDRRAWWSAGGTCVDLYAPGVAVTSSISASDTASATWSGTSMATPHVAGAAALYLERNPAMTPRQVADALVANATPGALIGHFISGMWPTAWEFRDLDVGSPNRLLNVGALALPRSRAPTARIDVQCRGLTCRLDATPSTDDVGIVDHVWWIAGRGVLRGRSVEHTFLGPVQADVALIATDSDRIPDTARAAFKVEGTPEAPCTPCAFETGITSATGALLWGPGMQAIRIDTPTVMRAWLSAPYSGEGVLKPMTQKLSLFSWDGTQWQQVVTTGDLPGVVSLAKQVDAGWYAWRIENAPAARHFVIWYRNDATRRKIDVNTALPEPESGEQTPM